MTENIPGPVPTGTRLVLTRPDDWHLHLRDGAMMSRVVADTSNQFARAIVMPNLKPPITTTAHACQYRDRIRQSLPADAAFEPLMTLYLTDETSAEEIVLAKESGLVHSVKYYPAGATTNSAAGVTSLERCTAALEAMQRVGLPLLLHGEVTDPDVDLFDRESVFIDRHLAPLIQRFPALRAVLEHVTTANAVQFVREAPAHVGATITAHHLLLNRNAMFAGGLRPHHYCLPVLKRETHRQALVDAATSGSPKFFLGTDSAPHLKKDKESDCGCAGIYTARTAMELYAEAFDQAGALDRLEAFSSFHGPDFYTLPRNTDTIALEKVEWTVPTTLGPVDEPLVPFRAGELLSWRCVEAGNGL